MRTKKMALLLAFAMILSLVTPYGSSQVSAATQEEPATQVLFMEEATSPPGLYIGDIIEDGWTDGGSGYEMGYWAYLRVLTSGITIAPNYYQFGPANASIQNLPSNVTAWYFDLDMRAGFTPQLIFHLDFRTAPEAGPMDLTLNFKVDGNDITTSFTLVLPNPGETSPPPTPSATPTGGPTPSASPTAGPTPTATVRPTPTATVRPTATPTTAPTATPTSKPTSTPRPSPTASGTPRPTRTPRPVATPTPELPQATATALPGTEGSFDDTDGIEAAPIPAQNISNLIWNILDSEDVASEPVVRLDLDAGVTTIDLYATDVNAIIEAGGTLVISTSLCAVSFNAEQLAAWGLPEDAVITASIRPVRISEVQLAYLSQLASTAPNLPPMVIENAKWFEYNVKVDGKSVDGNLGTVAVVDISNIGFTTEQLSKLSGAVVLSGGIASPINGQLNGNEYSFPIEGAGTYGVMALGASATTATPTTVTETSTSSPRTQDQSNTLSANISMVVGVVTIGDVAPYVPVGASDPMVPLRAIMEEMGAIVQWDSINRSVLLTQADGRGGTLVIPIDSLLSGTNTTPVLIQDRTFVPLSYIKQITGADISWDEMTRMININI